MNNLQQHVIQNFLIFVLRNRKCTKYWCSTFTNHCVIEFFYLFWSSEWPLPYIISKKYTNVSAMWFLNQWYNIHEEEWMAEMYNSSYFVLSMLSIYTLLASFFLPMNIQYYYDSFLIFMNYRFGILFSKYKQLPTPTTASFITKQFCQIKSKSCLKSTSQQKTNN